MPRKHTSLALKLFLASVSQDNKGRPFVIKPISSPLMKPLLVFVNPKSGGNQVRVLVGSGSQSLNLTARFLQMGLVLGLSDRKDSRPELQSSEEVLAVEWPFYFSGVG